MLDSDFAFVISIPVYLVFLIIQLKRKLPVTTILINSLLYFYLIIVIAITIFPFPIQSSVIAEGVRNQYTHNNFIPFASILELLQRDPDIYLRQIGGNILLTMPLGFLMPLLWPKRNTILDALKIGFLFSFAIEATQFIISATLGYTYKITDVDDILLNTLGSVIGFLVFKLAFLIFKKTKSN